MSYKEERLTELLSHLAAEFISRESGGQSLITVTGGKLSQKGRAMHILLSVMPEEKEAAALDFLNRQKKDFADYAKERTRLRRLPRVSFEIDKGEKNRRKVEEII